MVKREFSEYQEISDDSSDSSSDDDGPPPRSRIKLESEGDSPFHFAVSFMQGLNCSSHEYQANSRPRQQSPGSVPPGPVKIKSEPDVDRKDISSIPTQVAAPLIDATASTEVCIKCGEEGHLIEQCLRNSCKKCGEHATHLTFFCPILAAIRKKTKGPCGKCGILGHRTRKCKVNKCTACGAQGHTRKACLVNPPACGHCKKPGHVGKRCPFLQVAKANTHRRYVDRAT